MRKGSCYGVSLLLPEGWIPGGKIFSYTLVLAAVAVYPATDGAIVLRVCRLLGDELNSESEKIWYNLRVKKILTACFAILFAGLLLADEEVETEFSPWSLGVGGGVLLPGNGNSLSRAAQVSIRGGYYLTESFALEFEGACVPNASSGSGHATLTGVSAQTLFHLTGWEAFDKLFGCERFDPFLTAGVQTFLSSRHVFADDSHRTGTGPAIGFGALYWLSDMWAIRGDLKACLTLDSPCGMIYAAGLGLHCSFGGN